MNYHIFEGQYTVQSGHRRDIAVIKCPYEPNRIEVYDAHGLKILHGAQVYWTEIRRYQKRRETIIQAVVVGLKNCQYIVQGKEVICTLKVSKQELLGKNRVIIEAMPVQRKLPNFEIINGESLLQKFEWNSEQSNNCLQKIKNIEKKYFWVRVIAWEYMDDRPKGIVTSIFHQNDAKTTQAQTQVILSSLSIKEHLNDSLSHRIEQFKLSDLPYKFPKEFNLEEQHIDHQLPISSHKLFNQMMFTIDPETSVDIQDGLSLKAIANSGCEEIYQIGVHISDITSYSHLFQHQRDQIVEKGTSVYLPHKVIYMLPEKIVEMCRLAPKKYRLSFSVFFKVDTNGNVIQEAKFQKNIVKSVAKLSYQQAEDIIHKDTENLGHLVQKHNITHEQLQLMTEKIKILKKISFERRKNRLKSRGITQFFGKNQVTFKLDQKNFPTQIGLKKRLQSQKLIEQFMIMANQLVAKKLVKDYGQNSLVIHHPQPSKCSISYLNDVFSDFGVRFTTDNVLNVEKQIGNLLGKQGVKDEVKQLLIIRAMQIQQHASYTRYLNSSKGHFGLNLQCYTHFTSPLRRFADIIVHQQLQQCLKMSKQKRTQKGWKLQKLIRQIDLANKARFRNKRLKQKIVQCFLNMLLYRQNKTIKAKGLILSLGLKSATIYVPIYNIIKEAEWENQVQYSQKDTIKVMVQNHLGQISKQERQNFRENENIQKNNSEENNSIKWHQLHRNDSVDIEIASQNHQQVKINIIFPNSR